MCSKISSRSIYYRLSDMHIATLAIKIISLRCFFFFLEKKSTSMGFPLRRGYYVIRISALPHMIFIAVFFHFSSIAYLSFHPSWNLWYFCKKRTRMTNNSIISNTRASAFVVVATMSVQYAIEILSKWITKCGICALILASQTKLV